MGKTIHNLRGVRGQARRDFHEQTAKFLDSAVAEDSQWLENGGLMTYARKSSRLVGVDEALSARLDRVIDEIGVANVLATLVRLLDSRCGDDGDPFESFDTLNEGEGWKAQADAIEACIKELE